MRLSFVLFKCTCCFMYGYLCVNKLNNKKFTNESNLAFLVWQMFIYGRTERKLNCRLPKIMLIQFKFLDFARLSDF